MKNHLIVLHFQNKQVMERGNVVLLGQLGAGKTSLLNKICKSAEKVLVGDESATQNIYYKTAAYESKFAIIDTPGFGWAKANRFEQASIIISALELQPVSLILLVVKYGTNDAMQGNIAKLIPVIQDYMNLVVIVVTHTDEMKNPDIEKKLLEQFILRKYRIKEFMYAGNNISGLAICQEIDKILKTKKPQKIKITDTKFQASFNLIIYKPEIEKKLREDSAALQNQFQLIINSTMEFIENYNPQDLNSQENLRQQDINQVMHAIMIWIKRKGDQIVDKFVNDHKATMDEILGLTDMPFIAYYYQMELKKAIIHQLNQVLGEASKFNNQATQFSNMIRRCQHCGLIWYREGGCDAVYCGGKQHPQEASNQIAPYAYTVTFDETKQRITKVEKPKHCIIKRLEQKVSQLQNIPKIGCGKLLDWNNQPILSDYEIQQLHDVQLYDFLVDKQENIEQVMAFQEQRSSQQIAVVKNMKIDLKNSHADQDQQLKQEKRLQEQLQKEIIRQQITNKTMQFSQFTQSQQSDKESPTGILIGLQGSGKSTMIKLLNRNQQIMLSNEKQFHKYKCTYDNKTYQLIDTFGQQNLTHRQDQIFKEQQRLFFSQIHDTILHQIFIVYKYKANYKQSFNEELNFCVSPFSKYVSIITLITTHWDNCLQDQKSAVQNFIEANAKSFYKIKTFIYTDSLNVFNLSEQVFDSFGNSQKINLKFTSFDAQQTAFTEKQAVPGQQQAVPGQQQAILPQRESRRCTIM